MAYTIPHIPTGYDDLYFSDRQRFLRFLNISATPFEALVRLWLDIASLRPLRHIKLNKIPKSNLYLRTDVGYRSVVCVENEDIAEGIDTLSFLLQPEQPPRLLTVKDAAFDGKGAQNLDLAYLEAVIPTDATGLTLGQFLVLQALYNAIADRLYEANLPLVFTPHQLLETAPDLRQTITDALTELRDTCYRLADAKPRVDGSLVRSGGHNFKNRVCQKFPEASHLCALSYAAGVMQYAATEWPEVFPKSGNSESLAESGTINLAQGNDLSEQTATILRLLTHGDITKEDQVLACSLTSAMNELTAQIRESKQVKKKVK